MYILRNKSIPFALLTKFEIKSISLFYKAIAIFAIKYVSNNHKIYHVNASLLTLSELIASLSHFPRVKYSTLIISAISYVDLIKLD